MAVHRGEMQSAQQIKKETNDSSTEAMKRNEAAQKELVLEHLPPLPLVFTILFCSGALLIFALRDFLTTGRNIGGTWDEAMLLFTKSTDWFDDSKGWKSQQGGFSAVMQATTDANNMGGFFVRKLAGAAAAGVHLQKMMPMLMHPVGAQWAMGHFRPLLKVALIGNVAIAAFYVFYWEDLEAGGVVELPRAFLGLLAGESLTILFYLIASRNTKRMPAVAMREGKSPRSFTNNIVSRTILIVSTAMTVIAARDLFFPGFILEMIPRDDIYLEWTNAFLHSPPDGSPEAVDHGMESPLYIGDKFMSQFAALHILILCLYKFTTAVFIRHESDGSGLVKCQMIWKAQAIAMTMVLFCFRVFQPAAASASLDFRWHLMCLAYETFILGMYGFL